MGLFGKGLKPPLCLCPAYVAVVKVVGPWSFTDSSTCRRCTINYKHHVSCLDVGQLMKLHYLLPHSHSFDDVIEYWMVRLSINDPIVYYARNVLSVLFSSHNNFHHWHCLQRVKLRALLSFYEGFSSVFLNWNLYINWNNVRVHALKTHYYLLVLLAIQYIFQNIDLNFLVRK